MVKVQNLPPKLGSFNSLHFHCWVIFHVFFLSSADLFLIFLFKKSFRNSIRVSNSLDPDQDALSVHPDLGPNCLHMLSVEDKKVVTSKERVKIFR